MSPILLIRRIKLVFLVNQLIIFFISTIAVIFQWYSEEQYVLKLYQITSFSLSLLTAYVMFALKYKDSSIYRVKTKVNKMYFTVALELSFIVCLLLDLCLILELFGILSPSKAQLILYLEGLVIEPVLFGVLIPDLFDYTSNLLNKAFSKD